MSELIKMNVRKKLCVTGRSGFSKAVRLTALRNKRKIMKAKEARDDGDKGRKSPKYAASKALTPIYLGVRDRQKV